MRVQEQALPLGLGTGIGLRRQEAIMCSPSSTTYPTGSQG